MKKHNPKCPFCGFLRTQKRGSQKGKKRYFCRSCNRSFSVDHRKKSIAWIYQVDGLPYRRLGDINNTSTAKAYRQSEKEKDSLPENSYLSKTYCGRWSGILNLDGKHVKVKGYDKKIPFVFITQNSERLLMLRRSQLPKPVLCIQTQQFRINSLVRIQIVSI